MCERQIFSRHQLTLVIAFLLSQSMFAFVRHDIFSNRAILRGFKLTADNKQKNRFLGQHMMNRITNRILSRLFSLVESTAPISKVPSFSSKELGTGYSAKEKEEVKWADNYGKRSSAKSLELFGLAQLHPGDEGYFDVSDVNIPGVVIVRNEKDAKIVVDKLMNSSEEIIHACDTEVMCIDLSNEGPVGNGYVTCLSVYSGPDFDYGLGETKGCTLWIDNLDDSFGILQLFKPWLENPNSLKIWHNYGFDRHVLFNEGINVLGFGGDTMHMARLQDTSRGKYSLESLSDTLLKARKKPMKELFGVPRKRKDGSSGAIVDVPSIETLQRDPEFRSNFIEYSVYDSKCCWDLYHFLKNLLKEISWYQNNSLFDYYKMYMRPFGELLTDLERRGIRIDSNYLANVELIARKDREYHTSVFRKWAASRIGPEGLALNSASSVQLGTFLFGGSRNSKTRLSTDSEKVFRILKQDMTEEVIKALGETSKEEEK